MWPLASFQHEERREKENKGMPVMRQRLLCAPGINPIDLTASGAPLQPSDRQREEPAAVAGATTGAAPLPQAEANKKSKQRIPAPIGEIQNVSLSEQNNTYNMHILWIGSRRAQEPQLRKQNRMNENNPTVIHLLREVTN
uniref:Uncharacterized protein n=1 Tax=Oryza rufipogon TaxID=4529 RepID=A0A0E0PHP8_ORYRU